MRQPGDLGQLRETVNKQRRFKVTPDSKEMSVR
jgi:hypothetical protein